jgi:hypothetical protein
MLTSERVHLLLICTTTTALVVKKLQFAALVPAQAGLIIALYGLGEVHVAVSGSQLLDCITPFPV